MSSSEASPDQPAYRLIRVRVSIASHAVYSADDVVATWPTRRIHFGGAMGMLTSSIHMSNSRDILYIDKPLPLIRLAYNDAPSKTPAQEASLISRVAINLDVLSRKTLWPLWMALDNENLSSLILVSKSNKLKQHVTNVPSDRWGFRKIPEDKVGAEEPELYQSGQDAIGVFNISQDDGIDYSFVYHWQEQDEEPVTD